MSTKVISLGNANNFVSNSYLQSKKAFEHIIGDDREIIETNNTHVADRDNPFSIYYKVS